MPIVYQRRQIDKDPKKDSKQAQWSEKQKFEAVAKYKIIGNLAAVSESLGIPYETLKFWKGQEWWLEVEEDIRQQSRTELSGKLKRITEKTLRELEDRIENGDWYYDQKEGRMIRKPVGAHTMNAVASNLLNHQFALERLQLDERKELNEQAIADRLANLGKEFAKFSRAKTIDLIPDPPVKKEVIQTTTPVVEETNG